MEKPEIKITQEIVVYENKYGKLFDDDVLFLPQNVEGKYVRWKWNTPYSVGVLPVLENGNVVLIESFRHAARKSVIEIPKGFGNKLTPPQEMAVLELAEEAGLASDDWEYVGDVLTDTSFS
ncbi:MAG: NUDIX hydrolase [Chloroflexi bacterium]|nr:NUDIX hydrolase [Chloroflexota bacterium]